ncbi:universal stress protein [Aquimarina mytili]|uniref:Universal stress protein n=1 Tax=Aquimarina mytili TaxID=874423 RepID=A0A936ZW23_9FLAO|nr:universal stress protein [Aquimarina mytili]MBL0682066.1 universal stress protein [Aquimarina mytili]
MKRILIPTDFSENAWNTILYAMQLYGDVSCEFYILNSFDVTPVQLISTVSSQRVGHYYEAVKMKSAQTLEMVMADIINSNPDEKHVFKSISKPGTLIEAMEESINENHFDMIIIGTKGATGAKEVFLGSNTQKVIRNIDACPILVVPEDSFFDNITEIAFATDFERMYYNSEIKPIVDLAKSHNATVRMIHVYDTPKLNQIQRYNSNNLEHYFKSIPYDFHVIPDFSTIERAIQAFIEELEIDMLVMINYKHSFIERLTREAVIKKITFHTAIPFLIIPSDT